MNPLLSVPGEESLLGLLYILQNRYLDFRSCYHGDNEVLGKALVYFVEGLSGCGADCAGCTS